MEAGLFTVEDAQEIDSGLKSGVPERVALAADLLRFGNPDRNTLQQLHGEIIRTIRKISPFLMPSRNSLKTIMQLSALLFAFGRQEKDSGTGSPIPDVCFSDPMIAQLQLVAFKQRYYRIDERHSDIADIADIAMLRQTLEADFPADRLLGIEMLRFLGNTHQLWEDLEAQRMIELAMPNQAGGLFHARNSALLLNALEELANRSENNPFFANLISEIMNNYRELFIEQVRNPNKNPMSSGAECCAYYGFGLAHDREPPDYNAAVLRKAEQDVRTTLAKLMLGIAARKAEQRIASVPRVQRALA